MFLRSPSYHLLTVCKPGVLLGAMHLFCKYFPYELYEVGIFNLFLQMRVMRLREVSNLPKLILLVSGKSRIQSHICLASKLLPFLLRWGPPHINRCPGVQGMYMPVGDRPRKLALRAKSEQDLCARPYLDFGIHFVNNGFI